MVNCVVKVVVVVTSWLSSLSVCSEVGRFSAAEGDQSGAELFAVVVYPGWSEKNVKLFRIPIKKQTALQSR